jgi:hypothetical protein
MEQAQRNETAARELVRAAYHPVLPATRIALLYVLREGQINHLKPRGNYMHQLLYRLMTLYSVFVGFI